MLTEFQKAKLVEWAEWCLEHDDENMPAGIDMVNEWAHWAATGYTDPFPTSEQFAHCQDAATSEAI